MSAPKVAKSSTGEDFSGYLLSMVNVFTLFCSEMFGHFSDDPIILTIKKKKKKKITRQFSVLVFSFHATLY